MYSKANLTLFNTTVESIYEAKDFSYCRQSFLGFLSMLVPTHSSGFTVESDDDSKILRFLGLNYPQESYDIYVKDVRDTDFLNVLIESGKSTVYRETDLLKGEARENAKRDRELFLIHDIQYAVYIILCDENNFIGGIGLYRKKEANDFTAEEMFFLELLIPHLKNRILKELKKEKFGEAFEPYYFMDKYGLTIREAEILGLLFQGISNVEISQQLVISPNTLKKHSISIYRKLNIKHRWELVKFI